MGLTQKDIGQRIMKLRKGRGWSQEELSRRLDISRSSLAQVELGNRGVDILELQRLALVLEFSVDAFLASDFPADGPAPVSSSEPKTKRTGARHFALKLDKFRNVLLYLLERCAGKPNVGDSVLPRLLYFADFNHYELYKEPITGATYWKVAFGPVPDVLDAFIGQMINQKILQRMKSEFSGYPLTRYIPLQKPDLEQLKASEIVVIDRVIDQMSDWSASALSDYAHKDAPWVATRDGYEIDYGHVFSRELPFSVRTYTIERQ